MSLEKRGIFAGEKPIQQTPRVTRVTVLRLADGTQIEGTVHLQPGLRLLDHLNRQSEGFIAVTDASMSVAGEQVAVPFIAVNKSHIVSLLER